MRNDEKLWTFFTPAKCHFETLFSLSVSSSTYQNASSIPYCLQNEMTGHFADLQHTKPYINATKENMSERCNIGKSVKVFQFYSFIACFI